MIETTKLKAACDRYERALIERDRKAIEEAKSIRMFAAGELFNAVPLGGRTLWLNMPEQQNVSSNHSYRKLIEIASNFGG